MSIIDSFDPERESSINLPDVLPKSDITLDVCIINFSYKIMDALIEEGKIEPVEPVIKSVADLYPVYVFSGTKIGIVKTTVGAPMAAGLIEEIGYIFSCSRFVLFGSCGGLDKNIPPEALIVPTHAYRDEGMSYHYAPPADYIELPGHGTVSSILDGLSVPYVTGRTWTTDAFYRETRRNMEMRRSEGCIAVEMEISACQAVADFRGHELYAFLYRADNLDAEVWERSILSSITTERRLAHLYIALEIAKAIGT
ncbi:MAG: nucleoside phosphorylase [Clostridia bacterium]|nr:nucleoside phosphorylase [Clostridia bacterium]